MNQIFKVVFNAVRGKKMVVNEATSSVQKGKTAAVTVAVAGTLMLGANVAAVAADLSKAIGGNKLDYAATLPAEMKNAPTLNLSGGDYQSVISGHYVGFNVDTKYLQGKDTSFSLQSTSTNISGDVKVVEGVYAGSLIAGGYGDGDADYAGGTVNFETASTNLTIDGGEFGTFVFNSEPADCPQCEPAMNKVVTAGDFIKDRGINYGGEMILSSTVQDANLTINGGTFHSTIFGGSVLSNYGFDRVNMSSTVEKTTVTITNGTFKSAVFAGGAAMSLVEKDVDHPDKPFETSQIVSKVEEANLIIKGGNFEQGIYAGGLEGYVDGQENVRVVPHADVDLAKITVMNTTVKAIYGYNAKGVIKDGNWTYQNAGDSSASTFATPAESNGDAVTTHLKIINSTVQEEVDVADGSVELRVEGENGQTSVKTLSLGDAVGLKMTGDGTFNDATGGDIAALSEHITVGEKPADETVKNADLSLDEGAVMGAVTARLNENGEIVDKKVAVNDKTDSLTNKVVHIPQIINRIMMNDVRKRMGDIRSAEGTHGAWVRYNGGEMSGRGIDNDFNMIQVGFDTMPGADAPRFGVAFSYANSEADDGYGTADMDAYSLAAYATKFYDNGMFVDVIGRLAKIDTDLDNVGMTGKMDNLAVSLSGEFGWRFDVTKSLYVEPAVEATYTYMDSDEFTLGQGEYELESTDSFIGRAGIAAGFKCPANKGDVYVRAAVAHEFLGDATMNSSINGHRAAAVELDGKDTWIEFGLGANFNVNESTYVYADVERTEGAAIDEDWRANVGVRFAF